jgi:hypothetical protein
VVGQGSDRLPSQTLTDWVTYGDHVVIATVVAERELPVPAEVSQRGEGLIGRRITAHPTSRLWSRAGAPVLPTSLDLLVWGWVLQDGQQILFTSEGAPRPEVGATYVMPVVRVASGEWVLLAPSAVIPTSQGVTHAPAAADVGPASPLARHYDGRPVDELSTALSGTAVDPAARPFMAQDPDQRWASVLAARPGSQP